MNENNVNYQSEASTSLNYHEPSLNAREHQISENNGRFAAPIDIEPEQCKNVQEYTENNVEINESDTLSSCSDSSLSLRSSATDLNALACVQKFNENSLSENQKTAFGNVQVKTSENVHLGSKTLYKGNVTINQYLYNNPTAAGTSENESNGERKTENDKKPSEKSKNSDGILHSINNFMYNKVIECLQTKRRIVFTCLVILLIILVLILGIYLINLLLSSNNEITLTVPSPPSGPLNVNQSSDNSATIKWNAPAFDGGVSLEIFKIEYMLVLEKMWQEAGRTNASTHHFLIENLFTNKQYFFRVFAKNKVGFSKPLVSDQPFKIIPSLTVPSSPQEPLEVKQIAKKTVYIVWEKPKSDGGYPLEKYKIEIKDSEKENWVEVENVTASFRNTTIKNLQENHEYMFRVSAFNKMGFSAPLETKKPCLINPMPAEAPEIVSRKEWNALEPTLPPTKLEKLPAPYVIICSTGSGSCTSTNDCIFQIQVQQNVSIRKGHGDIDYNFLVGGDGLIYEGRGWDIEGNHTDFYNHQSIAIGFLGSYDFYDPKPKQLDSAKKLLEYGLENKKFTSNYKLLGQRQVMKNTDSPGTMLYIIIKEWDHWAREP